MAYRDFQDETGEGWRLDAGVWHTVTSTAVASIHWSAGVLSVYMKSGKILRYAAPREELEVMFDAPSKGRHISRLKSLYTYLG